MRTHLWRANAPGEKPAAAGGATPRARASAAPTAARGLRGTALRHEQRGRRPSPAEASTSSSRTAVGGSFHEGDLLRHKKFGDGVVTRVIDAHKVEVLFRDEARTLAQAMV